MLMHRWIRVVPLVTLAVFAAPRLEAAGIRDRAGMFSAEVVKKVESRLDRIERRTGIPVVIETIDSIPGLRRGCLGAGKVASRRNSRRPERPARLAMKALIS